MKYVSVYGKLLQTKFKKKNTHTRNKIMPVVGFNVNFVFDKVLKCQPLYFTATVNCVMLCDHRDSSFHTPDGILF